MPLPYRLGIIGLGRVAWLLEEDPLRGKPCTHLGAWRERPDVQLMAACDSDPVRLEEFGARHPGVALYRDYETMLARERLDLVSLCAYATERSAMAVACAEAGVRGIWCEKSMAGSLAEARRMGEALSRHGTRMIVAFMRRWAPEYHGVKRLLDEGVIGELESVNVHFSSNLLHTGTHAFDLLRLWCGELRGARAWLDEGRAGAEESGYRFEKQGAAPSKDLGGFALLDFESGCRATLHGGKKGYFRFEFELLGSQGMIRIGNTRRELWRVAESPRFAGFKELEAAEFPAVTGENLWRGACANLVAAVEGRAAPACGFEEGRDALAVALACHLSHREGHRSVAPGEVPPELTVPSR